MLSHRAVQQRATMSRALRTGAEGRNLVFFSSGLSLSLKHQLVGSVYLFIWVFTNPQTHFFTSEFCIDSDPDSICFLTSFWGVSQWFFLHDCTQSRKFLTKSSGLFVFNLGSWLSANYSDTLFIQSTINPFVWTMPTRDLHCLCAPPALLRGKDQKDDETFSVSRWFIWRCVFTRRSCWMRQNRDLVNEIMLM